MEKSGVVMGDQGGPTDSRAAARGAAPVAVRQAAASPVSWRDEARVTYALKLLALITLAAFMIWQVLGFFGRVRTVTIIVIGAIFFTYLIYPLVRRLNARLPLGPSIAIVYVVLAALVAFGLWVVVPALVQNIRDLAANAPQLAHAAERSLADPNNPFIRRLPPAAQTFLAHLPAEIGTYVQRYGAATASRALEVVISTVSVAALFIVIPIVAAYMLLEAEQIKLTVVGMIPASSRPRTLKILADLDLVIGGFIRGQIIVAVIVGSLVTVLLLALHVRYALLIGVVAGILDVIPYVGALAGWLPAFVIALVTNGWQNSVFVTIGIIAINQLEGHIIAPTVVSRSVELTPLVVVVALLTGGELMGIPGLLLAVPVAGIIRVLIINFRPPKHLTPSEVDLAVTNKPRAETEPETVAQPS